MQDKTLFLGMLFSIFSLTGLGAQDMPYESLWQQVDIFRQQSKPQSAYELVETIYLKSLQDGKEDQLIKSIIFKAGLSKEFTDRDPAEYIQSFEAELGKLPNNAAKAVLHSMLGEMYHNFGISNAYRFSQRSATSMDSSLLQFESLEAIQRKSVAHYMESLDIDAAIDLEDFQELLMPSEDDHWKIMAYNVHDFLLFRGIEHFSNSSAFATIPKSQYVLKDKKLFNTGQGFLKIGFEDTAFDDYRVVNMQLYQEAESSKSIGPDEMELLKIKRLEYVKDQYELPGGDSLYHEALLGLLPESVSGAVYVRLVNYHLNKALSKREAGNEESAEHFKQAFRHIQNFKKNFKGSPFTGDIDQLRGRLLEKELQATVEEVVPTGKSFRSLIEYRNVDQVYLKLYKVTQEQRLEWDSYYRTRDKLGILASIEPLRNWSITLKGADDFNFHSTEIALPQLDFGQYIVAVSAEEKISTEMDALLSCGLFAVSNLSVFNFFNGKETQGHVVDRITGKPVVDCQVYLYEVKRSTSKREERVRLLHRINPDDNGSWTYPGFNDNHLLRIVNGKDSLQQIEWIPRPPDVGKTAWREGRFFTDRAIYRPGQKIHFKMLALTFSGNNTVRLMPGKSINVFLRDVNNQLVAEQSFESNAYGSIEGSFTIPTSGLNGNYSLSSDLSNWPRHTIKVEEYKRPQIKAEFLPLSKPYVLGDTVILTGSVSSYSGVNIEGASIRYTVKREQLRWWYRSPIGTPEQIIDIGTVQSDARGQFVISFDSGEITSASDRFSYTVECDILDPTGESLQLSRDLFLASVPYRLELTNLQKEGLEGELEPLKIRALNLESRPVAINLKLRIHKLNAPEGYIRKRRWESPDIYLLDSLEFKNQFPEDEYRNETDPSTWEIQKQVGVYNYSGKAITVDAVSSLSRGAYKLELLTEDEDGNSHSEIHFIMVSDRSKSPLPVEAVWHSALNKTYAPGEKIDLFVNAAFRKYRMVYLIYHDGKVLKEGTLDQRHCQINFPVLEKHYGGIGIRLLLFKDNRVYTKELVAQVPRINKALNIQLDGFRENYLPGEEASFQVSILNHKGEKQKAEILLAMYDKSLDQFASNDWHFDLFQSDRYFSNINIFGFGTVRARAMWERSRIYQFAAFPQFVPALNWFDFNIVSPYGLYTPIMESRGGILAKSAGAGGVPPEEQAQETAMDESSNRNVDSVEERIENTGPLVRENLNETVFFFPRVYSKTDTSVEVRFTMNEALTEWKLLVFAHDSLLGYGLLDSLTITSKDLMIESFLPRFLRQADTLRLTARLSNNTTNRLETRNHIEIRDAFTDEDYSALFLVDKQIKEYSLGANESRRIEWEIQVPSDFSSALNILTFTNAEDLSDAESHRLPVVSNRKYITESLPLYCGPESEKMFLFDAVDKIGKSQTLESDKLSLRYMPDASWMVLKSLPFMLGKNQQTSIAKLNAGYGSLIGRQLLQNSPILTSALKEWLETSDYQSPLRAKENLKLLEISQTPWLNNALGEEENLSKLAFLLDDNSFNYRMDEIISDLRALQNPDGGFAWIKEGRSNWYVTQYILEHHLKLMAQGIDEHRILDAKSFENAIRFAERSFMEYMERNDSIGRVIPPIIVQFLDVRTQSSSKPDKELKKLMDYCLDESAKKWMNSNSYMQSLLGMIFLRIDREKPVNDIRSSLDERMVRNEETGYYWNDQAGYYWYELNTEKQAALIDFYMRTDASQSTIDGLRLWLLKNKQTNAWPSTKATASAVSSFYNSSALPGVVGTIGFEFPVSGESYAYDIASIRDGEISIEWKEEELIKESKKIIIKNSSPATGWGGMYWQYFEDLDKIQAQNTIPLKIQKQLGKVVTGDQGETWMPLSNTTVLEIGDRLRTRVEISVDRPMEFVLLEDIRGSGFEPADVISQYKWQDGLLYYQSTKDLSSEFFIEYLPKGNFVFEYDVFATHKGIFSGGLSTIQSMYAPEFSAHSEGQRIRVIEKQ